MESHSLARMMRRTWLDNALIIEGNKLLTLAKQISQQDIHVTTSIEALSNDSSLKSIMQKEWETKSLALEQILEALQGVYKKIRDESILLAGGDKDSL